MEKYRTALCCLVLAVALVETASAKQPPNILLLFVDDLGFGDLGCQGNETVKSPRIDKMSREGIRFEQWLSASSICTPSRGSLLTGRLPVRLGLGSSIYATRVLSPISPTGLLHVEHTLPEALKERGYLTHMTGKWHLGIGKEGTYLPTNHGFDEFYGMGVTNVMSCLPGKYIYQQSSLVHFVWDSTYKIWCSMVVAALLMGATGIIGDRTFLVLLGITGAAFVFAVHFTSVYTLINPANCLLYRNKEIIQQPVELYNLTQRHTYDAQQFIHRAHAAQQPWFLYMSYAKVHTALFTVESFRGVGHNEYIDNIAELDWSVGELLDTLSTLGIDEQTLVLFTSDNGPFKERGQEGGGAGQLRGMPLKGGKGQTWEGGIRVPGIVRWRGTIPAGVVTEEPVSTMDIYPTVLSLVDAVLGGDAAGQLSRHHGHLDGKDISALLLGQNSSSPHEFMFHYCGQELTAVRYLGRYKTMMATPIWEEGTDSCPSKSICGCSYHDVVKHWPPLLFDLSSDPGETTPLGPDSFAAYHEVMAAIDGAVRRHFATFEQHPNHENQVEKMHDVSLLPCCGEACRCDLDPYTPR